MESNALSSFESMSSSNLSKPLKIYQDHDSRYYLNVQTFKYTRDECLEPQRMLYIKESENHPALEQFLNTVWRWLYHKQCNNMNKLVIWMPDNLHCDDWFCKRCY